MSYQMIFKRYELKYLITKEQKNLILMEMMPYMAPDQYGRSTIRNIYYDTDNYRLIRHSIEKPVYKEKLRIRSYKQVNQEEPVFIELKKKYQSVVYKRRINVSEKDAMLYLGTGLPLTTQSQITKEVDYFCEYYQTLRPRVFLSYDREAFYDKEDSDFRVTFDENILWRESDLSLCSGIYGKALLPQNHTLMEIKTGGGLPLWMAHLLSSKQIFKTSFSKYGSAYQEILATKNNGGILYA